MFFFFFFFFFVVVVFFFFFLQFSDYFKIPFDIKISKLTLMSKLRFL